MRYNEPMTASFRYPNSELDQSGVLLSSLGTFWADTYMGNDVTESYLIATSQLEKQAAADAAEAVNCVARRTTPVLHTEQWQELILRESERNPSTLILSYGQPAAVYGSTYRYGQSAAWAYSAFAAPGDLQSVPMVCNRLTLPSVSLIEGVDYVVDPVQRVIVFRDNPFENANIAQREVYDAAGNVVDREASVWLFRGQYDRRHLFLRWGYPWGLEMKSSETYRNALNALWDASVRGTAAQDVFNAIAAILDVPVPQQTETVEVVKADARSLLVITDQRVYRFHPAAVPLVAVGDVVHAGMPLTNAVQFFEFNRGQVPDAMTAIHLERGFLTEGYYDGITFENKTVPTVVGSDGTYTTLQFEVGGWPLDVEKFWEDFHARGVAAGQTLAHLLDQRTNKVGEPSAVNLPTTINPLQFLCENVLRNHGFAVKIRLTALGPNAASVVHLRTLRRLVPAHTALLLLVEMEAGPETIVLQPDNGSYVEDAETFQAGEPMEETIDGVGILEEPVAFYVDGFCV